MIVVKENGMHYISRGVCKYTVFVDMNPVIYHLNTFGHMNVQYLSWNAKSIYGQFTCFGFSFQCKEVIFFCHVLDHSSPKNWAIGSYIGYY